MRSIGTGMVSQLNYYSPQENPASTTKKINESGLNGLFINNLLHHSVGKKARQKKSPHAHELNKTSGLRFGYNYSEIRSGKQDLALSNEY